MATHNRAGEITYRHAPEPGQDFRYEFTVTTYTNTEGSGIADRDSLQINWGDGASDILVRSNGTSTPNGIPQGEDLGNGINKNIYSAFHVYPGFNPYYVISMQDPNRNAGILNVNNGGSVDIEFYIEDTLFVLNPQFFGFNSSPVLSLPPIDYGEVGAPFIHNPTAFDPDGDSLVFKLVVPRATRDSEVPFYLFPDQIDSGPENNITLNSQTGEFIWDSPQQVGEYNIAFLITEYRSGFKIGTMIRDMQILVEDTGNNPPEIFGPTEVCVRLGDPLEMLFEAIDEDMHSVAMTAFGEPFDLSKNPANFEVSADSSSGKLTWNTICDHVFSDKYTVVIKAEDDPDGLTPYTPLVDLHTVSITVVAPPPTGLVAEAIEGQIVLSWDDPYGCASIGKFNGFAIYRSIGCDEIEFDECQRGLGGTSYIKIDNRIKEYTYIDESAQKGIKYSYRIVAEFADANNNQGVPINVSESHPSVNACAELPKDVPVITQVSVLETDAVVGKMRVAWSKPDAMALDTVVNPGPYTYNVFRTVTGSNAFVQVESFVAGSFEAANDTVFVDEGLNTEGEGYTYKIEFLASGDDVIGETETAGSIFVNILPQNEQLTLTWNEQVPWLNKEYIIYRNDNLGTPTEIIDTTTIQKYTDENLDNDLTYCYRVESIGSYFSESIAYDLLNDSQVICAEPLDTVAPCTPILTVTNDCLLEDSGEFVDFESNRLSWQSSQSLCGDEDVAGYNIYYQDPFLGEEVLLETVGSEVTNYEHALETTLAGCYNVTAIDSSGNESKGGLQLCLESCLKYDLPNAFTPGSDNQNDLFVPLEGYRFVDRVEFEVFNRWGVLVYKSEDPALNWNGTDYKSRQDLPEEVYFYTCNVYERSAKGESVLQQELSGYIHLFRKLD